MRSNTTTRGVPIIVVNNTLSQSITLGLVALLMAFGAGCDVSTNSDVVETRDGDPAVVDFPIAYVQRPLPTDDNGDPTAPSLLDPAAFNPGAKLIIKDSASVSAHEREITEGLFNTAADGMTAAYDVKDLSVSPDGSRLLFSMRAPAIEGADENAQPTWNIWQYDLGATTENERLRPLMPPELAERGHDVAAHYLPNGKIVFSSNRQARTRPLLNDENKPQYAGLNDKRQHEAFVLHTLDAGGHIEQITFNVSHDLQPTVLDNGDLLFLRHDGIHQHNQISLYTAKVNGSDLQPYYGYHSQNTGTNGSPAILMRPRILPDGRILAILRPRASMRLGGDIVAIDGANFIDIDQPADARSSGTAVGQQSLSIGDVNTLSGAASIAGTFSSAFPFYDGTHRLLVSWSPCRQVEPGTAKLRPCSDELGAEAMQPAAPLYGLWILHLSNGTQRPIKVPTEGSMLTDAVIMAPAPRPSRWQPDAIANEWVEEGVGVMHIRSVYDIDGMDTTPRGIDAMADPAQTPTDVRPVRFLRIVKNVPIPGDDVLDFDNSRFGRSTAQGMRDIIGYVAVEPDGSALFKMPANVPFMLDLLDAQGKRIGRRHENWLHLRPGEQRECSGCHRRNSTLPHGRRDAEAISANAGAVGGIPFANTRLLDPFGTPQPYPQFGESMAQYYARLNGPRTPTLDIVFTDEWTDPSKAAPGQDIQLSYTNIAATANANPRDSNCAPLATAPTTWWMPAPDPSNPTCTQADGWTRHCRITIHYLQAIAPLWQTDRRTCDEFGDLITDNTCASCHTRTRDGVPQVPAGQLELTNEASLDRNDYVTSYSELLFDDEAQEISDEGALADIRLATDTGEFETNANGEWVRDSNGQRIPIIEYTSVPVAAAMSTDGAQASSRFFNLFQPGASHANMLSAAELKLIAEWLDIGAQYYNDPFVSETD